MKTARIVLSAAALALASSMSSCSENKDTAAKAAATKAAAANANCPYTGKPINASVTRDYKGKAVGFCCEGCAGKWDNASDADRAAKMAAAK